MINSTIRSLFFSGLAITLLATSAPAAVTTLQLQNERHGDCLASSNGRVVAETCAAGAATQQWRYDSNRLSLVDSSGQCVEGKRSNRAVTLKGCNGKKQQQWQSAADGSYRNRKTGQCLAEASDGTIRSAKCSRSGTRWQEYTAPPPPAETDALINSAHGQCLNAANDPFVDVRNCDESAAQQWYWNATTGQLVSAAGKCIAANQAFNLVEQESCASGRQSQQWLLDPIANTLTNAATNQCLDVWGGEIDNEVGVWSCDGSPRQEWKFANAEPPQPPADSRNIINLSQGQCLHTAGGGLVNARDCDTGDIAQKWLFTNGELKNSQGQCIDATASFDLVSLASCNGAASQQWQYDAAAMTYTNAATGQCLDLWGGVRDNEFGVWTCDGSARQQFQDYDPGQQPGAGAWEALQLQFNGLDVAVDNDGKRLFYSLGAGYSTPASWTASVGFDPTQPVTLKIQGQTLVNGGSITLTGVSYGATIPVERYENGSLKDRYDLLFTNLPVIALTAPLITDEPKREGTFQLASGMFNQNTGTMKMGIEFRGATSQLYPKKSFSIQIGKDSDWTDERKLKLLGMRKDGDWILDATYRDTTFVRNLINHNLYREIHPYVYKDATGAPQGQPSIRGELVEVILNGAYHGVYVLSERVDRKLLDLSKVDVPEDASGNELWDQVDWTRPENGSVLYKAEYMEAAFLDAANYRVGYEQKYPKPEDVVRWEPLDELADFIINSSDAEFVDRVGDIFDIDSLVDYCALVLVGQAQDNTQKNFYLARNENGKYAIITWDFDATFGMFWDGSPDDSAEWFFPTNDNRLFQRLINLPATGFNARLKARWAELRSSLFTPDALAARFQAYRDQANLAAARSRNMQRWPESGGAGAANPELGSADYIRDLLVRRLAFVDTKIAELP